MSLGLLGNKIGMTQIFDESGNIIPVTILKVGPCVVTQVKTTLNDGYNAIQVGYGNVSTKSLTQPQLGHLQKSNIQPLKYLKEFRVSDPTNFNVGQVLDVESFVAGQLINVTGKSIGKGFSGLQKRYNFARGPMTHGSKNQRDPIAARHCRDTDGQLLRNQLMHWLQPILHPASLLTLSR